EWVAGAVGSTRDDHLAAGPHGGVRGTGRGSPRVRHGGPGVGERVVYGSGVKVSVIVSAPDDLPAPGPNGRVAVPAVRNAVQAAVLPRVVGSGEVGFGSRGVARR